METEECMETSAGAGSRPDASSRVLVEEKDGGVTLSGGILKPETLESLALQFPNTQFLILESDE